MHNNLHHGVGLLITDQEFSHYYVQIKDESYPYPEWRGACSFWGGAIEQQDSSPLIAVERELKEELPDASFLLADLPKTIIDKYLVNCDSLATPFWLTLFEVVVSDQQLKEVSEVEVLEGLGKLMHINELLECNWIWKMDFVFNSYLKAKDIS